MEGVEPPILWFVAICFHPLSYIPFIHGGGRRELNPRMMVPQTIALPLGDARHCELIKKLFNDQAIERFFVEIQRVPL